MKGKQSEGISVHLTERALFDISRIESWSVEQFGGGIANAYIGKLESALIRIQNNPELLRTETGFHRSLKFYRVEKHQLVCETAVVGRIIMLTVIHGSMDIPSRLSDLEPTLQEELTMLVTQLKTLE